MNFSDSLIIDAPREHLFALSQDYARRLQWDPFLKSAELLHGATEPAVGVRAWCVSHDGRGMETEYVSYNPPQATAVRMTRGPWILKSFAGSWRFDEMTCSRTRVTFTYHFQVRPACISWLLTPIIARRFSRQMRLRLEAVKAFAEGCESQ
ncbi:MAG: SRPBCC family protein [Planctomycetaceae bacterium]|nr:SRPBCC family protein [Planctomycetaceae bacterium]